VVVIAVVVKVVRLIRRGDLLLRKILRDKKYLGLSSSSKVKMLEEEISRED